MIAVVKGCLALLLLILPCASAADDSSGAARELARTTAAFVGRGETISVNWRNLSGLGGPDFDQVRAAFDSALREAGGRVADGTASSEARLTLSENPTHYLLVDEARKGEERQVWIASWKRTASASVLATGIAIEKKLVWQQAEAILDVASAGDRLLVLSPSSVTLLARRNGVWAAERSLAIAEMAWPRDIRGRLRVTGTAFQAVLPGMLCKGTVQPAAIDCAPSDEPWVIESGRAILLASFVPNRNFFDGRIITQSGVRRTVPAFFSAAAVEESGRQMWALAQIDGRTQLFDGSFAAPVGLANWGSDLASTDARCGGGSQLLATRPGDANEPDTVQAFAVVNHAPVALAPASPFPGPVTALWPAGGASAVAVARNLSTGEFEAYVLTVVCGS